MAGLYQRLASTIGSTDTQSIEYHIASIMMENLVQICDISIGEMAKKCSVSKSTISKFVRMLGFEDYQDFKYEAMFNRKKELYMSDGSTQNITDYMLENGAECYLDILFQDIRTMIENLDYKKLEQVVEEIHSYKNVAAFGMVYSETAAMNLQYKFAFYHKYIYTSLSDIKQSDYIRNAGEDTLLLIFSNSGRYIDMYSDMEGSPKKTCFDETKAKVVLFTANPEMEADDRVDICISWKYLDKVQNHPIMFQLLIEQLAMLYQKKYGFPMEDYE